MTSVSSSTPAPPPASLETTSSWTSTTAPGRVFASREELSAHYRSDLHRYNLKRKEAGLAPVTEDEFRARLEAAVALRRERESRGGGGGRDHLKKRRNDDDKRRRRRRPSDDHDDDERIPSSSTTNDDKVATTTTTKPSVAKESETTSKDGDKEEEEEDEDEVEDVDPLRSLFDQDRSVVFDDVEANVAHMNKTFGFFVPDREYLVDLEGLVGYCAEKMILGRTCLYCQRSFRSAEAVRRHSVDKGHCKIAYEEGVDVDEYEVFYDFSKANEEFLNGGGKAKRREMKKEEAEDVDASEDDDDEWEDVSDDDDSDDYDGYANALSSHGFSVTELGELVLPSGRVVGHRDLRRYYDQRFSPDRTRRAEVDAVLRDRYRVHRLDHGDSGGGAVVVDGRAPSGRALLARHNANGKGILVGGGGGSGGGFSAVSLYRYRAALKKSRRGEASGHRAYLKYKNNGNKFDKKGNRLVTNVSVAHALR